MQKIKAKVEITDKVKSEPTTQKQPDLSQKQIGSSDVCQRTASSLSTFDGTPSYAQSVDRLASPQDGFDTQGRVQLMKTMQRVVGNSRLSRLLASQIQKMSGVSVSIGSDMSKGQEERKSGLPSALKAGVENLSGMSMDDVNVHSNSAKPSAVQASAYTQGSNIYLGPDQEKHLPHEAWHVVQQKQGRVQPTIQYKGAAINDDASLECEADVMGEKALQTKPAEQMRLNSIQMSPQVSPVHSQVLSLKSKDLCKTKFDATKYVQAKVEKDDGSMTGVVNRLIQANQITVNGRRAVYASKMQRLNYKTKAKMHIGDCLIMENRWNDPNIAKLPSQKSIKSDLMAKIIATIYAEQTRNVPDQHRYIWYAIRKRIESWEKPEKLVYPGRKKGGVLSQFDAFGNKQYMRAKEYLLSNKKKKLPKSQFNSMIVDNIETMVQNEWSSTIPDKSGMFYFHWTKKKSPFLNLCWNLKENAKKKDKDRENVCVENFRQHLEWQVALVKSIPPSGTRKKGTPPFGTMYIFKSTRTP